MRRDRRFEHVVVDAASTDGTRALLAQLPDACGIRVLSEPDEGIYDGINKCTRIATGRYVLFLNAGDRLFAHPATLATALADGLRDDAQIFCFPYRIFFDDCARESVLDVGRRHRMPTSHQAMCFAAAFLRAHPYDLRYRIAGDFDLVAKAARERIVAADGMSPLVEVEGEGVPSSQPLRAYGEYALILLRGGGGPAMALARVLARGVTVVLLKSLLPQRILASLRRVFG